MNSSKAWNAKLEAGTGSVAPYIFRGVSGYLKLGGQVVMWLAAAAFYSSAKNCALPTRYLRP